MVPLKVVILAFFTVAGAAAVHRGGLLVVVHQGGMDDCVEVSSAEFGTDLFAAYGKPRWACSWFAHTECDAAVAG